MPAAPPPDEAKRIETLRAYDILDTPAERPFDCLAEMAAAHFGAPVALVSLIDEDRQWFKARIGLEAEQAPREGSFCAQAILRPREVTVVEDAAADPRFAGSALATGEAAARFYAGAPILAENGQPVGTVCVIDRVPRQVGGAERRFLANLAASAGAMLDLHRKTRVLASSAGRDPLTGLANRKVFEQALRTACAAAQCGSSFALLALDLNGFKAVNDTYGHDAGDAVLQEVGARLARVVRGRDLVARVGGDAFSVIVGGPIDATGLARVSGRIVAALEPEIAHMGRRLSVRPAIGAAIAPQHGCEPSLLTKAADEALQRGKRARALGVTLAVSDAETTLEDELRAAIAGGALDLHWQPYFRAGTGGIEGYEALLRWTRANGRQVSPMDVVAMAEAGGFIMDLDRMVLAKACDEAARWRSPVRVSVNISAWSFCSADLVGIVARKLARTGLDPRRLTIELTESTLVKHTDQARERIAGLHALGARVAMDDFGTGFASLGYLCGFDFDVLKLDRTFVTGIGKDRRAEAVATAVLALGKALDMSVCAEGVETEDQMRFLREGGCDTVQGYLLGRPRPRSDWEDMAERGVNELVAEVAQAAL